MNPKDVGQWAGIALALGTGAAAHFGVSQKASDADTGNRHTRELLDSHVHESKEIHAARERELEALRTQHARDTESLRMDGAATRERVIVLEQMSRQILEGQRKVESVLEQSTVTPKRAQR